MGRTHKTLTYEQENKLHPDSKIGKVKGVHRWGDNRKTSNRPPIHVDSEEEDELDDENPLYERILNVFKNGVSDIEFATSFSEALQNEYSEAEYVADIMISYLDQIITDENRIDVPDFGNMTQYNNEDFRDFVKNYFGFISQMILDEWIETYSSIS